MIWNNVSLFVSMVEDSQMRTHKLWYFQLCFNLMRYAQCATNRQHRTQHLNDFGCLNFTFDVRWLKHINWICVCHVHQNTQHTIFDRKLTFPLTLQCLSAAYSAGKLMLLSLVLLISDVETTLCIKFAKKKLIRSPKSFALTRVQHLDPLLWDWKSALEIMHCNESFYLANNHIKKKICFACKSRSLCHFQ